MVTLNRIRREFAKAFRLPDHVVGEAIRYTGEPHLFSVFVESGIPDKYTYPQTAFIWERLEGRLTAAYGYHVYFESINPGETRCYKVVPLANLLPVP